MLTDKQTIRQHQFRSDLPRFNSEGYFIFAQLEPEEQKLDDAGRAKLLLNAYAELLKDPSSAMLFDQQLTNATPLAYTLSQDSDPDYEIIEALYKIEGDRNAFSRGKLKVFKKAFAYFSSDDMRSTEDGSIPVGWTKVS